ncbi:MAG: bifunctional 4-hydroxy-2-oxoglutarate aldolase/2-dehydro-3-deoxy-phosphogluconate aldolase [Pirellulaceae bacterium]|nr:bifunctional 4-hydroxy-2-oxoglutarate aldolase/2-dehydro-3-deoxy-phosphogluconate aldolase [Pirellulaceae bacterium]
MNLPVVNLVLQHRLVAIIRLDDLSQAFEISRSLLAGGIMVQEYTLTNPEAFQVIGRIRKEIPAFQNGDACVGLGSVRNLDEANQAIEAGAQFVVTPTTRLDVIRQCQTHQVPIMPGAFTPTEISQAWEAGASLVKVFPARHLGPGYIKDVLAPMPYLKLMPTGGIDLANMPKYFENGAVAVGIGGQLVDPDRIRRRDWKGMTEIARQYAEASRGTIKQ